MDHNLLWFVSSTEESYLIYAIDISIATDDFEFSGHSLPPPILELLKSDFPRNMTFQVFESKLFMFGAGRPPGRDAMTEVYTIELSSVNLDLSMITQVSSLSIEDPIVLVCQDRLHALSKSLNPSNSTTPALIEVLDSQSGDSWLPYHLHVSLVEELSSISQSVQLDDEDPYRIIAYAARGPEIVLRLSMFADARIKSLTLNTQTNAWSFSCGDIYASHLPYPDRNLCLDSIWCPSDTLSDVHWMECNNKLAFMITIPSIQIFDYTKVIEFGKGMLLALSCTTDPENLLEYEQCCALVRVDFVRIFDAYCRGTLKPKKECLVVRAANYLDCTASASTRLQKVIYCYARGAPTN